MPIVECSTSLLSVHLKKRPLPYYIPRTTTDQRSSIEDVRHSSLFDYSFLCVMDRLVSNYQCVQLQQNNVGASAMDMIISNFVHLLRISKPENIAGRI